MLVIRSRAVCQVSRIIIYYLINISRPHEIKVTADEIKKACKFETEFDYTLKDKNGNIRIYSAKGNGSHDVEVTLMECAFQKTLNHNRTQEPGRGEDENKFYFYQKYDSSSGNYDDIYAGLMKEFAQILMGYQNVNVSGYYRSDYLKEIIKIYSDPNLKDRYMGSGIQVIRPDVVVNNLNGNPVTIMAKRNTSEALNHFLIIRNFNIVYDENGEPDYANSTAVISNINK